jgi:hypothetical protein
MTRDGEKQIPHSAYCLTAPHPTIPLTFIDIQKSSSVSNSKIHQKIDRQDSWKKDERI